MLQKIFATGIALACVTAVRSQDLTLLKPPAPLVELSPPPQPVAAAEKEPPAVFRISGYVDVYYRYNFANAKDVGEEGIYNNHTSFTNSQNSFELGMASVRVDHSIGKVSMVADLGFGKRAEEFSYNDEKSMFAIKEAYLSYALTENLKVSAGSWTTHVGYELLDPHANRNYSMSYMFSYGPFFHTGVKAEYTLGKSSFMVGLLDPNDLKTASFQQKMVGGQYTYAASDDLSFCVNYIGGRVDPETRLQQADMVIQGALSDKFSMGYNGTVQWQKYQIQGNGFSGSNSWWGSALYFNLDPNPKFGMTLRTEYFSDKKDVLGYAGSVFAATLSGNVHLGPLTIIPELRLDNGSRNLFVKHDGQSSKNTATALVAAIYKF